MNALLDFRRPYRVKTARAGAAIALLAVMLGAGAPALGQSAPTDPVVAVVNGSPIHESELELADDVIGRNLLVQDPVERREILLKMVTDAVLLAKVATDRKIEDQADLQRRATFARNQGLTNYLLNVVGQQAVTEEAMRKAYQEVVVNAVSAEPELHLRHLVIMIAPPANDAAVKAAEQKASAAMDRINKGEDFTAVVADMSDDPVTKARGGDYDWRQRGEMGKEYADVATKLKKGEVSQPFKTAVGWHILKLEDTRPRKPADYDKIRDRLAAMVASAAQIELVDKVRAEAKIELPAPAQKADKEGASVR